MGACLSEKIILSVLLQGWKWAQIDKGDSMWYHYDVYLWKKGDLSAKQTEKAFEYGDLTDNYRLLLLPEGQSFERGETE